MKTVVVESCQPVYRGDGPPVMVVGDIWDGKVVLHFVEGEESFLDLLKAATTHQMLRMAMDRTEQRRRKSPCNPRQHDIIKRRGKSPK